MWGQLHTITLCCVGWVSVGPGHHGSFPGSPPGLALLHSEYSKSWLLKVWFTDQHLSITWELVRNLDAHAQPRPSASHKVSSAMHTHHSSKKPRGPTGSAVCCVILGKACSENSFITKQNSGTDRCLTYCHGWGDAAIRS